jgi:hypothetical protein
MWSVVLLGAMEHATAERRISPNWCDNYAIGAAKA